MEFDKSKVFKYENAEQIKAGSLVYGSEAISVLKAMAENDAKPEPLIEIQKIEGVKGFYPFALKNRNVPYVYLVKEPIE